MEENNVSLCLRKYKEIAEYIDTASVDYGTALNGKTVETLLHKPTGYKPEEVCQVLIKDGQNVVGGVNCFTTRLSMDGEVSEIQSGSHLYVEEEYRKLDVGADLFMKFTFLHPSQCCLTGGISQMALKMYKVLKYAVFEIPRLIYLRKSRSVVQAILKSESPILSPIIAVADLCLALHRELTNLLTVNLRKKYKVYTEKEVPDEVEAIVIGDNSRYMEVHDKKWFEWALKYSFSEDDRNQKKLYSIRRNGHIEAFFLVKMEFFAQASSRGFKNVYLGSIMEWGIAKDSQLKESDLYLLALKYFPKNCDGIQVASSNPETVKRLKKYLFVGVGQSNMAARLAGKKLKEYNDINQWRIRLAAGDTIVD